jgi:hypothetical protein
MPANANRSSRFQQHLVDLLQRWSRYLSAGHADGAEPYPISLRQGLNEGGCVEGRNIEMLFRYAEDQMDHLPSVASDLSAVALP